jgi:hypothetical protein
MSRQIRVSYVFASVIVAAALLLAARTDNPWAVVGPGVLFVFVVFPRWRSKMYRLAEKAIGAVTRMFKNDRCTPPDL